jgi:AcrR family transcriptional regulator
MTAPFRSPLQTRSRDKQDRLIEAAMELVAERGFDQVRMNDIVERAGCAVGTAYYLFGNKEGLFRVLRDRFIADTRARFDTQLAPELFDSAPLAELIGRLVPGIVADIVANQTLLKAALTRAAADPDEWREFRNLAQQARLRLIPLMGARIKKIDHPDPELALGFALQLVFSACANVMQNDPGPLALDDPRFAQELTRVVLAYLKLA